MNLVQEYVNRHKLDYSPIHYSDVFNLIIKTLDGKKKLLSCEMQISSKLVSPRKFLIGEFIFVHNGWEQSNYVSKIKDSVYLFWDEYERYILNLVSESKLRCFKTPINKIEAALWSWESFLLVYDGFFAQEKDVSFLKFLASPCDESDDLILRYDSMRWAVDRLEIKYPAIHSVYINKFYSLNHSHPDWLADLINQKDNILGF